MKKAIGLILLIFGMTGCRREVVTQYFYSDKHVHDQIELADHWIEVSDDCIQVNDLAYEVIRHSRYRHSSVYVTEDLIFVVKRRQGIIHIYDGNNKRVCSMLIK